MSCSFRKMLWKNCMLIVLISVKAFYAKTRVIYYHNSWLYILVPILLLDSGLIKATRLQNSCTWTLLLRWNLSAWGCNWGCVCVCAMVTRELVFPCRCLCFTNVATLSAFSNSFPVPFFSDRGQFFFSHVELKINISSWFKKLTSVHWTFNYFAVERLTFVEFFNHKFIAEPRLILYLKFFRVSFVHLATPCKL